MGFKSNSEIKVTSVSVDFATAICRNKSMYHWGVRKSVGFLSKTGCVMVTSINVMMNRYVSYTVFEFLPVTSSLFLQRCRPTDTIRIKYDSIVL